MSNNDPLTTRWIRLQREAARAVGQADGPQDGDPVVPFADSPLGPPRAPVDEDDFGLERLVLTAWGAFFERFRPDEREFELPHYLTAGQMVEDRLQRLGAGARPDLLTCRMVIDLLRQFEDARFRDFNDRVGELMTTCQQLKAQLDIAELSKCYQEDELLACQRLMAAELERRAIAVPGPAEQIEPSPSAQLKALLAAIGAQTTAVVVKPAAPATPAPAAVPAAVEVHDIHARDSLDWTKLHSAGFYGKAELVALLLDQGFEINARAKDGCTPLHMAAKRGHVAVAKLLFTRGANLAAKDNDGNQPLHLAADLFVTDMLSALVAMGATVNCRNNDGWTPLHLACNRGKQEVVEYLLSVGADIDAAAGNGWTPLKVAVNCGHLQLAGSLRGKGARQ
jgi:hypothetical protein